MGILSVLVLALSSIASTVLPAPSAQQNQPQVNTGMFVGSWLNVDPNTRGLSAVTFRIESGVLIAHMWGNCHPTDCDWGDATVNPGSITASGFALTWNQRSVIRDQQVTWLQDGRLRVSTHSRYVDTPGRPNQDRVDDFLRCDPKAEQDCR
jgi:hypothetical protein